VVPVTYTPFPNALREKFDVDQCTFVTVEDCSLIGTISRFIGEKASKSFSIHKKKQSAIDTQMYLYGNDSDDDDRFAREKSPGSTSLGLGLGLHKYNFSDTDIYILYHVIGRPVGTSNAVQTKDVILLFVESQAHSDKIQKFVEHIIEWDEQTYESTFNIYKYHAKYNYWGKLGVKIARPMDSVVLPKDVKIQFTKDLEDFLAPETFRWYKDHGIPYKRSYLLYGPPGSGKSSIIQAIAGHYKLNLCYIQPIDPDFTDDSFTDAIQKAPKNALIVLEDIDTYFSKDRKSLNPRSPLTFSGLLNGLDGVAAADGQVFILTTNFIDRLDAALIRTGRVDIKFEFPKVSADMAREMFLQFYPGNDKLADGFRGVISQILKDTDLCMADLQQHFISHRKNNAEMAAENNTIREGVTGEQLKQMTTKLTTKKEDEEKEDDENSDSEDATNGKKKKKKSKDSDDKTTFGSIGNALVAIAVGVGVGVGVGLIGVSVGNSRLGSS